MVFSCSYPKREDSPTEDVHKLLMEGQEDASGSRDSTDEDIVLTEYVSEDESMKNERYYKLLVCSDHSFRITLFVVHSNGIASILMPFGKHLHLCNCSHNFPHTNACCDSYITDLM